MTLKILLVLFTMVCLTYDLSGQDPLRFKEEINLMLSGEEGMGSDTDLIVFTGSSSIRMWESLSDDFSEATLLNRGFGGSQMSDLLYYKKELILQYRPARIFIYEGDNDIWEGKSTDEILSDAAKLLKSIKESLPTSKVYFISAKPSIARWGMADKYRQFNRRLEQWTEEQGVSFIDIWTPMCDADGDVLQDLFIEDDLHMNEKGYAIWKDVIGPFVGD